MGSWEGWLMGPNCQSVRAVRRRAAGGALVCLLLISLGAHAGDLQPPADAESYKAQIVDVATRGLRQLWEDPQRYRIRVLD